ncbi:MAG: hypothetical protein ACN6N7_17210 [Chryseobacterium culicis]
MKKYISILGLSMLLVLLSCERESEDMSVNTALSYQQLAKRSLNNKEYVRAYEKASNEPPNVDNLDTGDDEPRPDKQHWKVKNDTIQ